MKLKFLGVGGAFAPMSKGNTNMMLTADNGERLVVDMGATAPYIIRDELGINFHEIDAVYISHLHGDHVGGMELFGFSRYFIPKKDADGNVIRPKLYAEESLMPEIWELLKHGMECLAQKVVTLTDYFDVRPVKLNEFFIWNGYSFYPVQTIHVTSGYKFKPSFGLMVENNSHYGVGPKTFITTDTQFAPYQLNNFYAKAFKIFHDCETIQGFKSGVHAHYEDLMRLPYETRQKMWLSHYGDKIETFKKDGFAGFVDKGQEFDI